MIPAANLGRLLTHTARRIPHGAALRWRERVWSWSELDARVDLLCAALRSEGIRAGDRVLVHMRNSNAMFESLWACLKIGAVWVPVNYRLTPAEVAYLATASGAVALLRDHGFASHAAAVRHAAPECTTVIAAGDAQAGELDYESLIAQALRPPPDHEATVGRDDPCWFFFTSGTTGRPKAATLTHGQMGFVVTNHLADLMPGLTERDVSLVIAPLSHGAGIHALSQVARGACSILMPGQHLDTAVAWDLIERFGVSNMFTVPTILNLLVEDERAAPHALRHVIYAGAPMYRDDQKRALQRLGHCLVQYFGLGEVTGNITVLRADQHSLDDDQPGARSCGAPRTAMDIAILDDTGLRLAPLLIGEICVRGGAVFAGYHGNPEATAQAFRDGWFHTGDLGFLDSHGFLHITGRSSDMFISGGANVYPREVEEALLTHPAVIECAVVGLPHPKWGEVGVACIVLRDPARTVAPEELSAHLEAMLAKYKHPRLMVFWDTLPTSAYGKVPKTMLRERLLQEGVSFGG